MQITYDPPPIPVRYFDWTATEDDYEPGDPIGHGRTRDEAVADLEEQLAERACQYADRLEARCVSLSEDMLRCLRHAQALAETADGKQEV